MIISLTLLSESVILKVTNRNKPNMIMKPIVKNLSDEYGDCWKVTAQKEEVLQHLEEVGYDMYKIFHVEQEAFIKVARIHLIQYIRDCKKNSFHFYIYPSNAWDTIHLII